MSKISGIRNSICATSGKEPNRRSIWRQGSTPILRQRSSISDVDLETAPAFCGNGGRQPILRDSNSPMAMIGKARQTSDAIDWRIGDIETWYEPNRFDLIFANASLHWIDDHESLTKRLLEAVKPSGIFPFQMPALYDQPVAQAVHELSESPAWKSYRFFQSTQTRTYECAQFFPL